MALFDKYFGTDKESKSEKLLSNEKLTEYIKSVKSITIFFEDLKELGTSFSDYIDEYMEESDEKYRKAVLMSYEPKIISLIILGKFFLTDRNYERKGCNTVFSLIEQCDDYKSVILRFAAALGSRNDRVYYAILNKSKEIADGLFNTEAGFLYIVSRISFYSQLIVEGLSCEYGVEDDENHPFRHAFFYYTNPHNNFPPEEYYYDTNNDIEIFSTTVINAYYNLQKILKDG